MILFDFECERPEKIEDAVALLRGAAGDVRLLAGGTDILPNMRVEIIKPDMLVSLSGIAVEAPKVLEDGSVRVDALSRLVDIERSDLLRRKAPMLVAAAHTVGSNQIRQMGTLGGNLAQDSRCLYLNQKHDHQFVDDCYKRGGDCCYPFPRNAKDLCWSVYMSDIAPGLIAFDAGVEILGPEGARRIAAADMFSGDGMKPLALGSAELIRWVIVPDTGCRFGWSHCKVAVRGGLEFGKAIIAVALWMEEDGRTCADARIALGAIEQAPLRPVEAEKSLIGDELTADRMAVAADKAAAEIQPLPHHGFTKKDLKDTIRVHLQRALEEARCRAAAEGKG